MTNKIYNTECYYDGDYPYPNYLLSLNHGEHDVFDIDKTLKDLSYNYPVGNYLPLKFYYQDEEIANVYILVGKTKTTEKDDYPMNLMYFIDHGGKVIASSIIKNHMKQYFDKKIKYVIHKWETCNLTAYTWSYDCEDFKHCIKWFMDAINQVCYIRGSRKKRKDVMLQIEIGDIQQFEHEYKNDESTLWAYYQEFAQFVNSKYIKSVIEKEKENGKK